jgi:hypothetical protein
MLLLDRDLKLLRESRHREVFGLAQAFLAQLCRERFIHCDATHMPGKSVTVEEAFQTDDRPPTSVSELPRVAMTGHPTDIASNTGKPKPSKIDGRTSAIAFSGLKTSIFLSPASRGGMLGAPIERADRSIEK